MLDAGKLETMARVGFAARGLLYGTIGALTLMLGRTEDNQGALGFLSGSGGRILLALMAIGFLGYGVWRLSEALIDSDNAGTDAGGIAKRIGGAISGGIHFFLCLAAVRLALGEHGSGGGDAAQQGASTALSLPGGSIMLGLVAIILIGVGAYQAVKAIKLGFLRHLDPQVARRTWIAWVGRAGYLARGTVFAISGLFLGRAALDESASRAGGMEQALDALPATLQLIVAAGFVMFGVFSLIEARYRRISDPRVVDRLRAAAAQMR
ncbi:DUF1206 domain-containing protein [Sphingomonas sanxanigenens]|uniref:DUF1206 domain-containing protein n=1 Tax=Sphingomonas sanxanigenens DSM 19645 = NX02 TaxID=1123269 RepID=W0AKC7_9SPHN|nr:DUF1206 domain-containing protein [Sphingomonas sanxanigenens]AHE56130.1 hypothetical protein NX02_22555 [Sphingomonas sanxanigenens DSM 19645 = NX02]